MALAGSVALVTGASRGIGRGIALQLGEAGATVYVTGRLPSASENKDGAKPELGTLAATADEISKRGGKGILVYCDHSKDSEVEALFARIAEETHGRLDILVNNAFSAVKVLSANWGRKFWEMEAKMWDDVNDVGLRNHYMCSVHAARLMVKRGEGGLIVNVSSAGGLRYLFNVAYGVGKAALDRMAADMAEELREQRVAVISLWPGAVKTEMFGGVMAEISAESRPGNGFQGISMAEMAEAVEEGESVEYAGKAVVALAADPKGALKRSGRVAMTADIGDAYGFKDIDGRRPPNWRSAKMALRFYRYQRLAKLVPAAIKIPPAFLAAGTHHY